jgi:hypothetical protein
VIDNAEDGYTADQVVAEIYPTLPLEPARRIIACRPMRRLPFRQRHGQ